MSQQEARETELFRAVMSQPAVIRDVLTRLNQGSDVAADLLTTSRHVFLTGTGTSFHAAIVGEHLLRHVGVDAYAATNFDFVTYPRAIDPEDAIIAISHRGSKRYGQEAVRRAIAAEAHVIGLTGQDSPMLGPNVLLQTAPQEKSSTHSVSYTANLAALGLIALHVGEKTGADIAPLRDGLLHMPRAIESLLANVAPIQQAARVLAKSGRVILVGAGPNMATAREGALKIKESSYLVAEGFELETCLHGGMQAVAAGDLAVVVAAHGPALDRTRDVIQALRMIGAKVLVVGDERVLHDLPGANDGSDANLAIGFEPLIEQLSPIASIVPLQLLADFTAALRGTDADIFRADDPVYKAANQSYIL
jgi:glucosamine--fructose-6-phosphate aminotransferase (isomerizing)